MRSAVKIRRLQVLQRLEQKRLYRSAKAATPGVAGRKTKAALKANSLLRLSAITAKR